MLFKPSQESTPIIAEAFKTYFNQIKDFDPREGTELTLRTALHNLLISLAKQKDSTIKVIHEPKRDKSGKGAPDFKFKIGESMLGYLENKSTDVTLGQVLKSEQIAKYKRLSDNLIITNYLEWIWLKDGVVIVRETLAYISDVGNHKAHLDPDKADKVGKLIANFLSTAPKGISRVETLALKLATRCHDLREFLTEELIRQKREHQEGRLFGLFKVFNEDVFHELTLAGFADAFAQMLGYGLFLARLNSGNKDVTLDNAKQYIPVNFELIRELVNFLDELHKEEYARIKWLIEEILSLMNTLDLAAIKEDLSFTERQERLWARTEEERLLFAKDPYVYFYQDFLKAYDKKMSKSKGVYYTPPPVVNFIIRGINDILQDTFGLKAGLADRRHVTVLDFATGTGTFLLEILQHIFDAVTVGLRDQVIREHALINIYGFEYLIAPYTIAHLKLSQFLHDKEFVMQPKERFQIYLTNTLERINPEQNFLLPAIFKEAENAKKIKETPIRVIVGNPPYNVKSKNRGEIDDLVKDAYAPSDEKKMNWDDYVKFIRFAHHKMEMIDRGIIGIITNNSYLNAITMREMRNCLMRDFNTIYILNLHGNSLIGELAPDGKPDANVFDIRVGTSIAFFVKTEPHPKSCKVYYSAVKSSKRLDKYKQLITGDMSLFHPLDVEVFNKQFAATRWAKRFAEPLSFFVPPSDHFANQLKAYGNFWGITDIFREYGSGVKTERDDITIHQTKKELEAVINDFLTLSEGQLKQKYETEDSRDWTASKAKADLVKHKGRDCYTDILYRPFDIRKTFYTGVTRGFIGTPGNKIGSHMLDLKNIGLMTCRSAVSDTWHHILATNKIAESSYLSAQSREFGYHCPLYLSATARGPAYMFAAHERQENFQQGFRQWLDEKYETVFKPEQVLGYIYAVLYSPSYRKEYRELLKIDFPRIQFVDDRKGFEALSDLGWQLVQAHLLNDVPAEPKIEVSKNDDPVDKPHYDAANQRLYANKGLCFKPVPQDVWNFYIGGYQALDKYLKYRKGRRLSLDEKENIINIVKVLRFTIDQMMKIDQTWKP